MSRHLQKLIHVGCRELGLDADQRRDLQLAVCNKASMKDMTDAELKAVVKRLKDDGFKVQSGAKKKHPPAPRRDLRMIHVLWRKLGEAGALHDASREGLNAFISKQFGKKWGFVPVDVDMLRDWDKINAVVQALKQMGKRHGTDFNWSEHGQ